ncbi:MAG: serine/threonine-protein phosphatase, partial [Tepidisphaeraceae bacterium]
MQLTYSQLSVPGPVRERNEDYIAFFHPATLEERRARGSVAIIADGVGGQGDGDIASRLAVESAMDVFTTADLDTSPNTLLWEMFKA